MKNIYIIILTLISCPVFSQINDSLINNNLKIIEISKEEKFEYYRIVEKEFAKKDEVLLTNEININSKNLPDLRKIIKSCNDGILFPVFYDFDSSNSFLILNKYDFIDLSKFVSDEYKLTDYVFEPDTVVEKDKKHMIIKRTLKNVTVVKAKISTGLYNKYTECIHITGDFDKFINVIFLVL